MSSADNFKPFACIGSWIFCNKTKGHMPSSACNWKIDAIATMAESMRFFMVNRILLFGAASYFKKLKGRKCANVFGWGLTLIDKLGR